MKQYAELKLLSISIINPPNIYKIRGLLSFSLQGV